MAPNLVVRVVTMFGSVAQKFVFGLERLLTFVAGTALICMMAVVAIDIIGRTIGLWNVLSTVEQTKLYMMLLGFLGLSLCFRNQENIVVDVATQHLSDRQKSFIDAFWSLISAAVLGALAYYVFENGLALHGSGQRSEVLGISPLVHYAIAGFGLAAAAIVSLFTLIRQIAGKPAEPSTKLHADIE